MEVVNHKSSYLLLFILLTNLKLCLFHMNSITDTKDILALSPQLITHTALVCR